MMLTLILHWQTNRVHTAFGALYMCVVFLSLSACNGLSNKRATLESAHQASLTKVPDVRIRTLRGETILLSALYKHKPLLLSVYLGTGCPMCVMNLQQLSQRAERIRSYGWELAALSNDTPEENRMALERPKGDSSFVQPGGSFSIALYSDSNYVAMEVLGCYRRDVDTERHGLFLIDRQGHIRFEAIGRRPFEHLDAVIDSMRALQASQTL